MVCSEMYPNYLESVSVQKHSPISVNLRNIWKRVITAIFLIDIFECMQSWECEKHTFYDEVLYASLISV